MKKNWIIGLLLIIIFMLIAVIAVTIKNNLESGSTSEETLVNNTGTKIMKTEGDTYISYIVEDYERNLTYTWSFPKTQNYQNNIISDRRYYCYSKCITISHCTKHARNLWSRYRLYDFICFY